jgi:hypothetical protein
MAAPQQFPKLRRNVKLVFIGVALALLVLFVIFGVR